MAPSWQRHTFREVEAARAGKALGVSPSIPASDAWLYCLFQDARRRKSEFLLGGSEKGGIINPVCDASAAYCARLEKEAIESVVLNETPTQSEAEENPRAVVDAFLVQCNREPNLSAKVIRKHIWRSVGHKNGRQFQYWQAESAEATESDRQNFQRVIDMAPRDFISILTKKGIL